MCYSFRFFSFFIFLLLIPVITVAQYTSPGDNLNLTFSDLVALSDGVVVEDSEGFVVNDDIIISETDLLLVDEETLIKVEAGKRIEIFGRLISSPNFGTVTFTAVDTLSTENNFRGFRFEDAEPSAFRNTVVKFGGGIQLIGTFAEFEDCVIRNNGISNSSSAITFSNTSPVINNCEFRNNLQSAIGSAANVQGSPVILNSRFIHNVTNNTNRPQINLGPGVPGDTLRIENNYIEGNFSLSGGIALATLTGGSIVASIRNNTIVSNRYGYTQVGNNINSVIEGNRIIDNNLETNPMNGGSGLNFFGSDNTNTSTVKNNLISGNLWGITIQGNAQPSFGNAFSNGGNVIFDNGNSGVTYALFNNTPQPISAIGNYWGDNSESFAESVIFDQTNDPNLGLVSYLPIKNLHPNFDEFGFLASQNPSLNEDVWGDIDDENATIQVTVPPGTGLMSLTPSANADLGVTVSPEVEEPMDFLDSVVFTLSVPHNNTREWTVTVAEQVADSWLQFVHQSADPILETVDVYFNGELYLESFKFREATPFTIIDEGSELLVEIKAAGTDEILVSRSFSDLGQGTIVFHGLLEPESFLPNPNGIGTEAKLTFFEYIVPLVDGPLINLFHAATDLQTIEFVDLAYDATLFSTSYGDKPDSYANLHLFTDVFNFEIRDAATGERISVYQLDLAQTQNDEYAFYLSGFMNPSENQQGAGVSIFGVSFDGEVIELQNVTTTDPGPEIPLDFALNQNYPNPFNPTTTISFDLPEAAQTLLSIYTVTGQLVSVLINENRSAGTHVVSFDGSNLSSGMYIYRLDAGEFSQTRKMMLVK